MKLPGSIQDYIDGLEDLESSDKEKLVDYIKGLEDLPEDPTDRQAKSIVRSAQRELADKEAKIIRQKAPKKKDKPKEPEVKEEPKEEKPKKEKKEKVKIEEGLKLSFKAFLSEVEKKAPTGSLYSMLNDPRAHQYKRRIQNAIEAIESGDKGRVEALAKDDPNHGDIEYEIASNCRNALKTM